jgi:two-component system, NarL family, response regulator NreC
MNVVKILLVDDHPILREGLKALINLQADMRCIGEASDGESAVAGAQSLFPDVVVLDVSMPKLNGFQATEQIVKHCPKSKVLSLTRHSEDSYVQQLLKAGASGYVLKQSSPATLLAAIRTVAAGQSYLDPAVTDRVISGYAAKGTAGAVAAGSRPTERENSVLRLIALGYSNKEIASQMRLSVKTIEAHKTNAMRKLNMRGRIDIVKFAVLQGWLEDKE